jgi:CRP-like cAMP-binding protein
MNDAIVEDRLAELGANSLLEGLAPEELKRVGALCRFESVPKGAVILTPDSAARDVYLVLKGRVRIVNFSLSGREVAYATAAAGDFFGEISAIDGEPRSATVAALERCELAILPDEAFITTLMRCPAIALRICRKLARIVRTSDERIMDLATLSAYQRVYGELLKLVKPDPVRRGSWLIYPLPTQASIAALASTTRETVARVLSQLAHSGLAERKGRTLYVRDLAKLRVLGERLRAEGEASS